MSPQLTIIAAAMSLGGMASVGFNHHEEVEKQVADFHENVEIETQRVEVAEIGDRVENKLESVQESFRIQLAKDREDFHQQLTGMQAQVKMLQSKQSSHDVLMDRMSEDYTSLEFKWETLSKGFRPVPSIGGRFAPVRSASEAHPLLPPVSEESSWKDDY